MRLLKFAAMLIALMTGGLMALPAGATPVGAGALPAAAGRAQDSLATQVQYYYGGPYRARPRVVVQRQYYRPRPVYGRSYYRPRPAYVRSYYRPRPVYYRPRPVYAGNYYRPRRVYSQRYYAPRPAYRARRVYRPVRTVCRTRIRLVRTYYGTVRRPVQVCRRVY